MPADSIGHQVWHMALDFIEPPMSTTSVTALVRFNVQLLLAVIRYFKTFRNPVMKLDKTEHVFGQWIPI
jgi:hypothetical protein